MTASQKGIDKETLKCIRKWGGASSDAILDSKNQHFYQPAVDGLIGYRLFEKTAVVYGDPLCDPKNWQELVTSFYSYCDENGISVVYLMTSLPFYEWAKKMGFISAALHYGSFVFLNPQNDPRKESGTHASLVRRKVRHAEKEGTSFHEYLGNDAEIEKEMEKLGSEWVAARKGPQVHISHVSLFANKYGKRWFYAQKEGKLVGTVVLNELKAKAGWHLNHLMANKDSSHGTPEMLVIGAIDKIREEGSHYVSFGIAPAKEMQDIYGLSFFTSFVAKFLFKAASRYFHLNGFESFWGKFNCSHENSYILFREKKIGLKELKALKEALNIEAF